MTSYIPCKAVSDALVRFVSWRVFIAFPAAIVGSSYSELWQWQIYPGETASL